MRRFPAEWEPHAATWIFWPRGAERYLYGTAGDYREVRAGFVRLIDVLAAFEPTVELVVDPSQEQEARAEAGRRARLHALPLDDAWARDTAPSFVLAGEATRERVAVCWSFNGWGQRFTPWERDAAVGEEIAFLSGARLERSPLAWEGGAMATNGSGRLLTTAPVLQDPARRGERTAEEVATELQGVLGADELLVLPEGMQGDDTGGHVDQVAAWTPTGVVLVPEADHLTGEERRRALDNEDYLRERGVQTVRLPSPDPVLHRGRRLTASYLNFYPVNDGLLVPAFGQPGPDERARAILGEHFPNREIVGIESRPFLLGGGGLHCLTQPQPSVG
jgi:agmatine deiminase